MPFAGVRADDRAGVEPAAIDAHGAAETAADLEGGFDYGVAGEARGDRLEIPDFPGRIAAGHSVPPRRQLRAVQLLYGRERPSAPEYRANVISLPAARAPAYIELKYQLLELYADGVVHRTDPFTEP